MNKIKQIDFKNLGFGFYFSFALYFIGVVALLLSFFLTKNYNSLAEFSYTATKPSSDYFLMTDANFLPSQQRKVQISASSANNEDVTIILGRTTDIQEYIQGILYTEVDNFGEDNQLVVENHAMQIPEADFTVSTDFVLENISTSDNWLKVESGRNPSSYYSYTEFINPHLSFLVFSQNKQELTVNINISKQLTEQIAPFVMIFSSMLILLGIILMILFYRFRKNGKSGTPISPNALLFFLVLALILPTLPSCSPIPPTVEEYIEVSTYPNLNTFQVEKILDETTTVYDTTISSKFSSKKDIKGLIESRINGPASTFFQNKVYIATKQKKTETLPGLITSSYENIIIDNDSAFPRIFFVNQITEDGNNFMIFVQENIFDNYHLWSYVRVLPGITVPQFSSNLIGNQTFDSSATQLIQPPLDIVDEYGDVLKNGDDSEFIDLFSPDELQEEMKAIAKVLDENAKENKIGGAKWSDSFKANEEVHGIYANDGSGIMFVRIDETINRNAGTGRLSIAGNSEEKILLGSQDVTQKMKVKYELILAFYVPKEDSDEKISLIGAERYPTSVEAISD